MTQAPRAHAHQARRAFAPSPASAAADERHDLDHITPRERPGPVLGFGDQAAVHLDRAGALVEAKLDQERRDGRAGRELAGLSIDGDGHDRSVVPARRRREGPPAVLAALLVFTFGIALGALAACERPASFSQETPDDVVKSLVGMVKSGEASRIDDLIYAESDRMRAVLHRVGELLGQLQKLAAAVQERFPADVARLKAEAMAAAESGEAPGSVGGFSLNFGGGGRGGGGGGGGGREMFQEMAAAIFADPYGWIDRNAERLSTMRLTDDLATMTLDDQPVFPPLGVPLKLDGGKWYFSLPTNLPGAGGFMPRTDAEWSIIGSMVKVFENAVAELTEDVKGGRVASVDQLAEKAGEKVIWPALLTWGAYNRELDVRRRRDRLTRQFDKRERDWVKAAKDSGWEAPGMLATPIAKLVPPELDRLARKDDRPNFEKMTEPEFAEFLEGVLGGGGLRVASISREVSAAEIEAAVARWQAEQKEAVPPR